MKKEVAKMDDNMENKFGSSPFSDNIEKSYPFAGIFDFCEGEKSSSLGFMELLGAGGQDYFCPTSLFDYLPQTPSLQQQLPSFAPKECPEYSMNQQPATPNSSSISSTSSEAVNDEQTNHKAAADADQEEEDEEEEEEEEEEHDHQKTKKQLKAKKASQKKLREPRFAFMTKSEVDHLEDGYRWRKYGQKAVKNSPFPRSYYRCTSATCNVKKRVERSFDDPSIVVTTYEGQHTHPSPLLPRPALTASNSSAPPLTNMNISSTFAMMPSMPGRTNGLLPHHYQQLVQQQQRQPSSAPFSFGYLNGSSSSSITTATGAGYLPERRFCTPSTGSALLTDHGLLQDIIPSHMLKQE